MTASGSVVSVVSFVALARTALHVGETAVQVSALKHRKAKAQAVKDVIAAVQANKDVHVHVCVVTGTMCHILPNILMSLELVRV